MKAEAFIDVSAFICMRHFVCNSKQYFGSADISGW